MTVGLETFVKSSGLNTEVKGSHVQLPTPTPRHPGGKAVALGRPTLRRSSVGLSRFDPRPRRIDAGLVPGTHPQGTVVARQPIPRLVPGPVLIAYRHTVCGPGVVGIVKV